MKFCSRRREKRRDMVDVEVARRFVRKEQYPIYEKRR
jgi:hypothetical protein